MPSRRSHKKSRHGCIVCKQRKVKCDEIQPRCTRCSDRNLECHYSLSLVPNLQALSIQSHATTPPSDFPSTSPSNPASPLNPGSLVQLAPVTWSHSNSQLGPPLDEPIGTPQETNSLRNNTYNSDDLALVHHYSTDTCIGLAGINNSLELWQTAFPKMAFDSPFLLHGILATAACHIYHQKSELTTAVQDVQLQKYFELAKHHYAKTISLYRVSLTQINPENVSAIFALSLLLICLSFAMPHPELSGLTGVEKPVGYIGHIIDSFRMIRGIRGIRTATAPYLQESIFHFILHIDRHSYMDALNFDAEVAMRLIESKIESDILDIPLKEEYKVAVNVLRECNPQAVAGMRRTSVVLAWAGIMPSVMITEIEMQKPIALAMLTFFGTLLHQLRDIWWIDDKGKKLVEATAELLPRGWESVVVWAKMNVGASMDGAATGR